MRKRSARHTGSVPTLKRRGLLKVAAAVVGGGASGGARRLLAAEAADYPPARAVTSGPKHHFFGYYDRCPWDARGKYLLAMENDFYERNPEPGEPLTVGVVDLTDQNRYKPLERTTAWCWQQGTMAQWLGQTRDVIYNSVDDGRYISIVRHADDGTLRKKLPRPVYIVSRDGKQAMTLDFPRVNRLRPGYGYIALPEAHPDDPAPENEGIYWMNLETGRNHLVVTLDWAARQKPDKRFDGAHHWFNHLLFNPSGTRFIFLHRWRAPRGGGWWTRLYTADPDGSEIRLLSDVGMVSHFHWRDDHTILAWTKADTEGNHFYLIDDRTARHTVIGDTVLTRDGHCSWSPDGKWILNDTYPDSEHKQTLMLFRPADGKRIDVGRFHQPPELRGKPYRCDLHPRWNRDGTQVCIDSTHELSRQMYVIDVSAITRT